MASTSSRPPDTGELRARVHFMKVFGILADHHGLQWSIVGGFLRRLFSNAPIAGNLDILLTNRSTSAAISSGTALHSLLSVNAHFQKVIKELEIIGFLKDVRGSSATGYTGTVAVCVGDDADPAAIREVAFELVVKLSSLAQYTPQCSADSLSLSSTGLISTSIESIDRLNPSPGITILERLVDLRLKTVSLCGTYYNNGVADAQGRKANSQLMLKEHKLWLEGFQVTGNTIVRPHAATTIDPNDSCPICFEKTSPLVEIQCKHAFCIPCLAKHMSLRGESHGRCPLCRAEISLGTGTGDIRAR